MIYATYLNKSYVLYKYIFFKNYRFKYVDERPVEFMDEY